MNDALKLIEHFERAACEDPLRAHRNPYGTLAIGYGHTRLACEGQTITHEHADDLLIRDVESVLAEMDRLLMPTARHEINANMRQAVASFAHSIGLQTFRECTVISRLNARRYCDVPKELAKFNHCNGRELRILTRRRQSESALFCSFPNWLVK